MVMSHHSNLQITTLGTMSAAMEKDKIYALRRLLQPSGEGRLKFVYTAEQSDMNAPLKV